MEVIRLTNPRKVLEVLEVQEVTAWKLLIAMSELGQLEE